MTTNSFGTSPIPKFGYEPTFSNAARGSGLPASAKLAAIAVATGLAYYNTSQSSSSSSSSSSSYNTTPPQPSPKYAAASESFRQTYGGERQFLAKRLSSEMRKRQKVTQ